MSSEMVSAAVEDVLADLDRQGSVSRSDVERIIEGKGLDGAKAVEVLHLLAQRGIDVDLEPEAEAVPAGAVDLNALVDSGFNRSDTLGTLLKRAARIPLLTPQQEVELGRRIALAQAVTRARPSGNLSADELVVVRRGRTAHEALVVANIRLVVSIAKRYVGQGLELIDLVQEGMFGLLRAADKFDHTLGFKFSTYATWWVRQAITRGIADKGRTIRLPVHVHEKLKRIRSETGRLERIIGRRPTIVELAAQMQQPAGELQAILDAGRDLVSLDAPLLDGDGDLAEVLNLYSDDLESEIIAQLERERVRQILDELESTPAAFSGDPARAVKILRLRFGLEDGRVWTLDEIGRELNVTRERIRQLVKKALVSPSLIGALAEATDRTLED